MTETFNWLRPDASPMAPPRIHPDAPPLSFQRKLPFPVVFRRPPHCRRYLPAFPLGIVKREVLDTVLWKPSVSNSSESKVIAVSVPVEMVCVEVAYALQPMNAGTPQTASVPSDTSALPDVPSANRWITAAAPAVKMSPRVVRIERRTYWV